MDGLGVRPAVLEIGERLATYVYFVLLPDLFYRSGQDEADRPLGGVVRGAARDCDRRTVADLFRYGRYHAAGGLTLFGVSGTYDREEDARVRDWHDFLGVFAARTLVFFGLTMSQTFVLFFFRDAQKVDNPSAGTGLYAFSTIIGAVLSDLYLGVLSDRAPRKIVNALALRSFSELASAA